MLIDDLESNGKLKVADLRKRYASHCEEPQFPQTIAEAVASSVHVLEYNGGVLLKAHLDAGHDFTSPQWELIIDALSPAMCWPFRLTLCQALTERPQLLSHDKIAFADFLHSSLSDRNAFLRAWAISAFWALASIDQDYAEEALEYRKRGLKDPAISVRTRMRNLIHNDGNFTDANFKNR